MSEVITGGGVTPAPTPSLTSVEQYALHGHEQVIERGLATFYEVGTALLAIRDERLYRARYSTFEDYCQERWGMSRIRAHQMIDAANVAQTLLTIGEQTPANERQARELAKLNDVDQVIAWKTIVETAPGGKITAGHVEAVADMLRELRDTGTLDTGDAILIPASDVIQARLTAETYERMHRQREHINEGQRRKAHVSNNSGDFEWYTPAPLIEAARAVMGGIDCDPATSEIANRRVQAATIYTLKNSGLDANNKWRGRVWMNPPYARSLVEEFMTRLLTQLWEGETSQACVLVNNATETIWFQSAIKKAAALCLVRGRVTFENPQREDTNEPLQGQAVFYFGEHAEAFERHFAGLGVVLYVR